MVRCGSDLGSGSRHRPAPWPDLSERTLFLITRLSIVIASIIVGVIVLLGLQFVDLLLFMFAVQIAFAIPITLAILRSASPEPHSCAPKALRY